MLCSARCTEERGGTDNTALFHPCCCHFHLWDNADPWLYSALDEASQVQMITLVPHSSLPKALRKPLHSVGAAEDKEMCFLGFQPLGGGKALVLLFDSRPPALLHTVNNQLHAMCHGTCLALILLQSRVLELALRYSCCLT